MVGYRKQCADFQCVGLAGMANQIFANLQFLIRMSHIITFIIRYAGTVYG